MLRVCIVDDERPAINRLQQLLEDLNIEVIGTFTRPSEMLGKLPELQPDVAFLDIEMPGINGLELASAMQNINPRIEIVFVTAFNQYALDAFRVHAIDYLVKPVDPHMLQSTIARLAAVMPARRQPLEQPYSDSRKHHEESPVMTITLFRQFSMSAGGREITPLRWRTSKAQELFLYMLQHRGRAVRKSTLIDLLWPEYAAERALSQLYTSAYHIRKTVADYADHIQILSTKDTYLLRLNGVQVDVDVWEAGMDADDEGYSGMIGTLMESMALYAGDYLQEYDYLWAESERQRLKQIWLRAAFQLADHYTRQQQSDKAIQMYQDICSRSPQTEDAHLALMQIYSKTNQHALVRKQYQLLKDIIEEEFNMPPSAHVQQWYDDWAAQHPVK